MAQNEHGCSGSSQADGQGGLRTAVPTDSDVPRPDEIHDGSDSTGVVVWHRKHVRTDDHLALARAVEAGDVVCPLFVFDPAFYGTDGIACDARIRFLHEALASLDKLYAATPAPVVSRDAEQSRERLAESARLDPDEYATAGTDERDSPLSGADAAGLTFGYGDPVDLLARFVDRGWSVVTMATPSSRYGKRRDENVRDTCGDAIEFVSGDGLVRDAEWSRSDWQSHMESWLTAKQHSPDWADEDVTRFTVDTGVTPAAVDDSFGVIPDKTKIPQGTHRRAVEQLRSFVDRLPAYPQNISAPGDARGGTSGLSPYLNFGVLSVRQVHQYVTEHGPSCRGLKMFTDRLVWNMHYNQKLVDWPGWTDKAVNPALEGFNEDRHDPDLVDAWKRGETGFPMVDASMRCLRETGWLNFRMRAMCASFFAHVLQQPWWIGADWYHHHLIDSDVGINYTQWQSQAGLIGKPSQRVYNPRKQVRDQDPEGEWIREWVSELSAFPSEFLDRPERAPLSVQAECGIRIGKDYPRPIVDFEARREAFWSRYERHKPKAARQLARQEIAKRASFSGGYDAARRIAQKYGEDTTADNTQVSLSEIGTGGRDASEEKTAMDGVDRAHKSQQQGGDRDSPLPTGTGERAGEPSPDDGAVLESGEAEGSQPTESGENDSEQANLERFN